MLFYPLTKSSTENNTFQNLQNHKPRFRSSNKSSFRFEKINVVQSCTQHKIYQFIVFFYNPVPHPKVFNPSFFGKFKDCMCFYLAFPLQVHLIQSLQHHNIQFWFLLWIHGQREVFCRVWCSSSKLLYVRCVGIL